MGIRQSTTQKKGRLGENLAVRFLKKNGFRIVTRNYRCRFGEIDVIAEQDDQLVFVEVRSHGSSQRYLPEETVNAQKQQRLSRTALTYIQTYGLEDRAARFDIIAVETGGSKPEVRHLPDAFEIWEP